MRSSFASTLASGVVMASIFTSSLAASSRIWNLEFGMKNARSAFQIPRSTFLISSALPAALLGLAAVGVVQSAAPRFYPDDPVWQDDDRTFDASKAVAIEDPNGY